MLERLGSVSKLASAWSNQISKAESRGLIQQELAKHVDMESLRAVAAQHAQQLESLGHEMVFQGARVTEEIKQLQHNVANTGDRNLPEVQRAGQTCRLGNVKAFGWN